MTGLLAWRFAERSDRALLPEFSCTGRSKRRFGTNRPYHPKPWELCVQSGFRALKPPLGPDQVLLIGEDSDGVGALTYFAREASDWSRVDFIGIAIECRLRGKGGSHAREAMDRTLAEMQGRAQDARVRQQFILVRIDKANEPSKRLCGGAGFRYLEDMNDTLEYWELVVDL